MPITKSSENRVDLHDKDFQKALELMKYVHIVRMAQQADKELKVSRGNIYVLPETLALHTGPSS